MQELFDQLVNEGEPGIARLIEEGRQETVVLDFKAKSDRGHGKFNDDDKRVFGKALSAFANSSGGLIIWGIDARKGPDGIDCAQASLPITNIELFRSEANRLAGELLMPRHEAIFIEAIPCASDNGSGYLLVRVERSERRPHRNEARGDKQYYKRSGDNSFAMEHYDIEDAFKRFSVPNLEIKIRFATTATDGNGRWVGGHISLALHNPSSVSAKLAFLQVRNLLGAQQVPQPMPGIIHYDEDGWTTRAADVSTVIHPGTSRTFARFNLKFSMTHEWMIQDTPAWNWSFLALCRYGCENSQLAGREIILGDKDLGRLALQ